MSIIRNISALIGVAILTLAAWMLSALPLMLHSSWATVTVLPVGHCGVTSYDLISTAVFAAWIFILGRFGRSLFVGRFGSQLRFIALVMPVAMFLFAQGLFIPGTLTSPCVFPHLALAAGVIAVACYVYFRKIPAA